MLALITLVEGEGDEHAIPSLLMKILSDLEQWSWYVGDTVIVQNMGKLKKGLAKYLNHAVNKKNFGNLTYPSQSLSSSLIENMRLGFLPVYQPSLVIMVCRQIWYMKEMWKPNAG
jgi:hypothetical protein